MQEDGLDDCYTFGDPIEPNSWPSCPTRKRDHGHHPVGYPGLQVYTGKYIDVANGKGGKHYGPYSGIALETQMLPDSPHHPCFPSTRLNPGERYLHKTIYSFNCISVEEDYEDETEG